MFNVAKIAKAVTVIMAVAVLLLQCYSVSANILMVLVASFVYA